MTTLPQMSTCIPEPWCMTGIWSEWKIINDVDDDVKKICELVKPEAEERERTTFTVYTPLNYRIKIESG
ncbi:hypothetical protein AMELA_G00243890, partial [Ameiurus melas]